MSGHIFHGVRAETVDKLWDWVDVESLLWVLDTGTELTLWRDFEAHPRISNMNSAQSRLDRATLYSAGDLTTRWTRRCKGSDEICTFY